MRRNVLIPFVILPAILVGCSAATPSGTVPSPATSQSDPVETSTGVDNTSPSDPANAEPVETPEPPKPVRREMPQPVRGILVSGWYAGSADLVWPLLDWAKTAGINTLVVDLKAEDGYLSWEANVPLAQEIGATKRKIGDLPGFIAAAHERGFWVAGRIVVMNDQWLYKSRPEWGVPGFPGGPYSFMDPKNENVWQYNIDIAKAAITAGIDEIQWDYLRYPEKLVEGYNKNTTPEYRTSHINAFLKRTMEELKPLGVVVGADLFGLTTSVAVGDDMEIGQDYSQVAQIVDYVAAMAYPSHYAPGTYGLANPNANPYDTVKISLSKAIERSPGVALEKHRPWIQDFSMGGITYGPAEVMAQVRALDELGIHSFMLWDPSCKFSRGVDYAKS